MRPGPIRPRVLVVDDNQPLADVICETLQLEGYDVSVAYDANRALELCHALEPKVVLLDMHLPPWHGEELLSALSFQLRGTCTFVAMTGDSDAPQGVAEVLTKPFTLEDLIAVVKAHVGRSQTGKAVVLPGQGL